MVLTKVFRFTSDHALVPLRAGVEGKINLDYEMVNRIILSKDYSMVGFRG